MNYNFRKAETKDIGRIVELLSTIANLHNEGRPDLFKRDSKKYNASDLREILRDKDRTVFVVADDNDYVFGYAFCYIIPYRNHPLFRDFKTLYIDDLCIDENLRGMGIGKSLFKHCRDYAWAAGCYNIELNVWCFNERAVAFYKSIGMSPQCYKMELILDDK